MPENFGQDDTYTCTAIYRDGSVIRTTRVQVRIEEMLGKLIGLFFNAFSEGIQESQTVLGDRFWVLSEHCLSDPLGIPIGFHSKPFPKPNQESWSTVGQT